MEYMLNQTQGKQMHDLHGEQLLHYIALSKEKNDKVNVLRLLMTNDRDYQM